MLPPNVRHRLRFRIALHGLATLAWAALAVGGDDPSKGGDPAKAEAGPGISRKGQANQVEASPNPTLTFGSVRSQRQVEILPEPPWAAPKTIGRMAPGSVLAKELVELTKLPDKVPESMLGRSTAYSLWFDAKGELVARDVDRSMLRRKPSLGVDLGVPSTLGAGRYQVVVGRAADTLNLNDDGGSGLGRLLTASRPSEVEIGSYRLLIPKPYAARSGEAELLVAPALRELPEAYLGNDITAKVFQALPAGRARDLMTLGAPFNAVGIRVPKTPPGFGDQAEVRFSFDGGAHYVPVEGSIELVDAPPKTLRDLKATQRASFPIVLFDRSPARPSLSTLRLEFAPPVAPQSPEAQVPRTPWPTGDTFLFWTDAEESGGKIRLTQPIARRPGTPQLANAPPEPLGPYEVEVPSELGSGKFKLILGAADSELLDAGDPTALVASTPPIDFEIVPYAVTYVAKDPKAGDLIDVKVEPAPDASLELKVEFATDKGSGSATAKGLTDLVAKTTPTRPGEYKVEVPSGVVADEPRRLVVELQGKSGAVRVAADAPFVVAKPVSGWLQAVGVIVLGLTFVVGLFWGGVGVVYVGSLLLDARDGGTRSKRVKAWVKELQNPSQPEPSPADPSETASDSAATGYIKRLLVNAIDPEPVVSRSMLEAEQARAERAEKTMEQLQKLVDELTRRLPKSTDSGTYVAIDSDDQRLPIKVPHGLVDACTQQRCVLFAGFGVGAAAGMPTFSVLLADLLKRAKEDHPQFDWSDVENLQGAQDVQAAAELIRRRLNRDWILNAVLAAFNRPIASGRIYGILKAIPFAGVLNWGWDRHLAKAFESSSLERLASADHEGFDRISREDKTFFVDVNGDVDRPATFLFNTAEFRRAMAANNLFSKFVNSCFANYTLFFVGTNIASIGEFLASLAVSETVDAAEIRHYALMPRVPGWRARVALYRAKYGIETIEYDDSNGHGPALEFLEALRKEVEARPRLAQTPARTPRLDRIKLRNIGPFTEFELDLHAAKEQGGTGSSSLALDPGSSWNVLLGNNGCGKSTLLRAVSLGLCGDDREARAAAGRLLKTGANEGRIELILGGRSYATTLRRESDGRVHVESGMTPLQAGRWVILGFPAIRGVPPREAIEGPAALGREKPNVRDVLPLLEGVVDWRLRNLKQWIVNNYLIKTGTDVAPSEARRASKLLDSFFSIVGSFIPGVTCELSRVDRRTWTVYVKTDDGEVDIDQLSQGTGSMVGWVGTLLQRMYEIYVESPEPESQPALVLIDEIDSHLHPEWQQILVPVLRSKFPRLQVVATTHSPLVLLNMKAGEVVKLVRTGRRPAIESKVELLKTVEELVGESVPDLGESERADYANELVDAVLEATDEQSPPSGAVEREVVEESMEGLNATQALTGPLELVSALDHRTAVVHMIYSLLAARADRTGVDDAMLERMAEIVRAKVPTSSETDNAIKARELIRRKYLDDLQRMSSRSRGKKERILLEVVAQLIETGGASNGTEVKP